MANVITSFRILCSVALLFCPAMSAEFYVFYILAGLSDMVDGAVARKTGKVSAFGSKLDTVADLFFSASCLIKLLPRLDLPLWVWIWTGMIALIKIFNILYGYIVYRRFTAEHTYIGKAAGALLFVFPLTLAYIPVSCSAGVVCTVATAAVVWECVIVTSPKQNAPRQ